MELNYTAWQDKRIMFMYAHIDDMEMSSGGLFSYLIKQNITIGSNIYLTILTNSNKGCGNPDICGNSTTDEIAEIRQSEQENVASIYGIPGCNILYLPYDDCMLKYSNSEEINKQLITIIRDKQPHVMFTWEGCLQWDELIPSVGWGDLDYHPDHQISGSLTLDATWGSHLDRLYPNPDPNVSVSAWKVEELYYWSYSSVISPTHYVDITGQASITKTEAFLEMYSQYQDPNSIIDLIVYVGHALGEQVGLPSGSMAEAYTYVLW